MRSEVQIADTVIALMAEMSGSECCKAMVNNSLIEQIVRVNRIDSRSCGRRAEAVVLDLVQPLAAGR